jgi:predicted Zn-ribbon and HTH transcriptional regulator
MVKESNIEGEVVYLCEKCGWSYKDKKIAEKCQSWCENHKSCNLKYQKHAIKL